MLISALILAAGLAASPAAAATPPYDLAEAGVTVQLPRGWEMTRWSDWDFKGKADGLALDIWTTPWQVEPAVGTALQPVYAEHLKEQRARDAAVLPGIAGVGGRAPWVQTRATFGLDGGGKAVAYFAALATDGKVVHIGMYGAANADRRAASDLAALVAGLTITKPAAALPTGPVAAGADAGFGVTPPAGWRAVLASERDEAVRALAKTGAGKLDACALLAAPGSTGGAAVMAACPQTWQIGFADDNSFADDAGTLRALVFGKAAATVPDAEKVALADRNGMLFRPTVNDHALRFATVAYDKGAVSIWAIGPADQGEAVERGVQDALSGLVFSGPENGLAQHAMGDVVFHALSYDPVVMGGAAVMVLGVLGGLGFLVMRKPARPSELA